MWFFKGSPQEIWFCIDKSIYVENLETLWSKEFAENGWEAESEGCGILKTYILDIYRGYFRFAEKRNGLGELQGEQHISGDESITWSFAEGWRS